MMFPLKAFLAGIAVLLAGEVARAESVTIDLMGQSERTTAAAGTGIFAVNSVTQTTPVTVSITLDTTSFGTEDISPDGLISYVGRLNSSIITVSDSGGSETFDSSSTSILTCLICAAGDWVFDSPDVYVQAFTPAISIDANDPLLFAPTDQTPGSGNFFNGYVGSGNNYLGFSVNTVSVSSVTTPEPVSVGYILVGLLIVVLGTRRGMTR